MSDCAKMDVREGEIYVALTKETQCGETCFTTYFKLYFKSGTAAPTNVALKKKLKSSLLTYFNF